MSASRYQNPYDGLAASVVTSHIIDTRDAFDMSLTAYIASGTSSLFTYQVSNNSAGGVPSSLSGIPEASWSNWTLYVAPSGNSSFASCLELPISYRWGRIVRTVSGASFVIEVNKQIRERGSL
jgi:hypothetical protein